MPGSEGRQIDQPARRRPVFDLPPAPDVRRDLVRIVDPAGLAVAWVDPGSAWCAGFMIRSSHRDRPGWQPVFAVPDELAVDARLGGCAALAVGGGPGSQVMDAGSMDGWSPTAWRLFERDPTSVILEAALRNEVGPDAGDAYGRLVTQIENATLTLDLTVRNDGIVARPMAVGLWAVFAPDLGNGSFRVLGQVGGGYTPLRVSAAAADRFVETRNWDVAGTPPAHQSGTPDGAPPVVVTCHDGVHSLELLEASVTGSVALAVRGSPSGRPVLVLPGASTRLAISVAVRSIGEASEP